MNLEEKKCVPCEGGVDPFDRDKIEKYLKFLGEDNQWQVIDDKKIQRDFSFKDFSAALDFINQIGKIAESENHHPDLNLHNYKKVTVTLSTFAINGLSENDFILAAKINNLTK